MSEILQGLLGGLVMIAAFGLVLYQYIGFLDDE